MRMGTTVRAMAVAAALAALPAGLAAQAREASDDNDRAVHAFLSAVDLGEVQQSMLAMQRATTAEVRTYAQSMIADHSNALHTREMLMQTENSGLMTGMDHGGAHAGHGAGQGGGNRATADASRNQGPLPPAYGPGNGGNASGGSVPEGQRTTSAATGSQGTSSGQLPPAYGPGNGGVNVDQSSAQAGQGAHAGHGAMQGGAMSTGLPAGVTPGMVQQLEAMLAAHPMSRPVVEANTRNLQVLQGVNGPQFDASYMDAQIGAHRYALQNIDRMLAQQNTLGDDIRGALQMMRTAVAAHLQTAEQIRARLQ